MTSVISTAGPASLDFAPAAARRPARWTALVVTLAAMGIASAVATSGPSRHPFLVALARAAAIGVPVAVGLHARSRHRDDRFGLLLVAMGAGSFVTALAESSDDQLYTLGRIAGWLFEALLVYVILSFPMGRVEHRVDRTLAGAMGLIVLLLYLPRAVLAEAFEIPSPFTSCVAGCPGNDLFPFNRQPGIVDAVMRPAGSFLVFAVTVGVSARLLWRLRHGTRLERRMLAPVFWIAAALAVVTGVGIAARQLNATAPWLDVAAWLLALAVPTLALACFAGFVRWRMLTGRALERLALCLEPMPDCVALRRAFAEAFDDPDVQILFPAGNGWHDCFGRRAPVPASGGGAAVTEVRHDGGVIAALVHDAALNHHPELLAAGVAIAAVALDVNRLAAGAAAATLEVQESRARMAVIAEGERRRIERDLHDGAQQRLVALRIELDLTQALVLRDAVRGAARLRELETELDEALDEIRSLAHGMYPPLLADRGLADALRAAVRASKIPIELEVHDVGRYAPEIESAVYFCVRESLQNVLKHAAGARRILVALDGGVAGDLRFVVKDNGPGAANGMLHPGAGITNMRDRLAAVGGDLRIRSTPGVGTVVSGRVRAVAAPAASGVPVP